MKPKNFKLTWKGAPSADGVGVLAGLYYSGQEIDYIVPADIGMGPW